MLNSEALLDRYRSVRRFTELICEPLEIEDYVAQSMPDVSPAKWHLAHTSWFFETFILDTHLPGYTPFHPQFRMLFNSYYNSVGARHCRPRRGVITRPTVAETYSYRRYIDEHIEKMLQGDASPELESLVVLGLHHEQQHQELLVTDIKHVLWQNPSRPVYRERATVTSGAMPPLRWVSFPESISCIGFDGPGFSFDNEGPRHRELIPSFALGSRLVTNGEYMDFIADGGYKRADLWLSAGWEAVQSQGWGAPLYWEREPVAGTLAEAPFGGIYPHSDTEASGEWYSFTLSGYRPVDRIEAVCHVSYYEADAFAHWAGSRLPTEFEWEAAATPLPIDGEFADDVRFHPSAALDGGGVSQLYGDVWEWTRSSYSPYPGYAPAEGALGEYNGKFMSGQYVLRGGSCATHSTHIRPTYRNFFPPDARWQFSGIRLAKDGEL